jgi:hypothetical protein
MLRTQRRPVLFAAAVAVAVLVGCGTSSGSDAADEATTTAAAAVTTTRDDGATTTEAEGTTTTEVEPTTTTAASGDGDAICAPMKALAESDAEANALVATGDWAKIQAFYVGETDDIVAIYDEAIALDTEITDDLETLRSVTVSAGDLAESSSSLMDFSGKLSAQPNLAASGQAALSANEYVEETCGFPLAGF